MNYKLEDEESEILDSIEKGEWKSVPNVKEEIQKYQQYAKASINKDKRINIRMSSRDLDLLKVQALRDGLPYQTLISSVLHKYVNGYL